MSAFGDSVLLGAQSSLAAACPGVRVDAVVGRQAGAVLDRVRAGAAAGTLAPVVVVHTGSNGIVTQAQLAAILGALADRDRVVVVTVHVPRRWMSPDNTVIRAVVPRHPNAVVADWAAASEGRPEYFVSDGVHLSAAGLRAYTRLLVDAATR